MSVLATRSAPGTYLLRSLGVTALDALVFMVAPTTAVAGAMLFGDPFMPATFVGLLLGAVAPRRPAGCCYDAGTRPSTATGTRR